MKKSKCTNCGKETTNGKYCSTCESKIRKPEELIAKINKR